MDFSNLDRQNEIISRLGSGKPVSTMDYDWVVEYGEPRNVILALEARYTYLKKIEAIKQAILIAKSNDLFNAALSLIQRYNICLEFRDFIIKEIERINTQPKSIVTEPKRINTQPRSIVIEPEFKKPTPIQETNGKTSSGRDDEFGDIYHGKDAYGWLTGDWDSLND